MQEKKEETVSINMDDIDVNPPAPIEGMENIFAVTSHIKNK